MKKDLIKCVRWLGAVSLAVSLSSGHAAQPGTTAGAIPFKSPPPASEWSVTRIAGSLILLALVGGAYYYVLRRKNAIPRGQAKQPKQLRIIESQRLGHGSMLHIIEFDGRRHLLAQSAQGVTRIASAGDTGAPLAEADRT